jgi:hypothetical protein
MAYSTSIPPRVWDLFGIGNVPKVWAYFTADTAATVDTSGYFTNGYDLGMRDGDLLFLYVTGTKVWTTHTVTVSGTTVNITDGTVIGSGTNTD